MKYVNNQCFHGTPQQLLKVKISSRGFSEPRHAKYRTDLQGIEKTHVECRPLGTIIL